MYLLAFIEKLFVEMIGIGLVWVVILLLGIIINVWSKKKPNEQQKSKADEEQK